MTDVCLIYGTAATTDEARRIGRVLIEERLAACVNILGPCQSLYRWEGEIREDGEVAYVAKTRRDRVPALTERIVALHSYDCPAVVAVPVEGGSEAFLRWVGEETAG